MPRMFAKDGTEVRRLTKLFVRDGDTVRQLTRLYARDGNVPRPIYDRIQRYLLSGTAITTQSAVVDIQRLTVTGRSNVFLPPENQEIDLLISTNFNSGGVAGSNTSSSSSTSAAINIGDGVFVDVDDNHTYSGRDEAVLAPANNGSSISNPATFTFNPTRQFTTVNWTGNTSSDLLHPYRVRTNNRGAAGARISDSVPSGGGRGQGNNIANGWQTGFDLGNLVATPTFSATNITSPAAIGTITATGNIGDLNVDSDSGTSECLNLRAGSSTATPNGSGVRQSGTSASQGPAIALTYNRGSTGQPWSPPGGTCGFRPPAANSFMQILTLYTNQSTLATGVRVIVFGPDATYNGRRARLRNSNTFPITITGTFGSTTLAAGASTDYITVDADSISWNVTYSSTVASWSADVVSGSVSQRNFSNEIGADAALTEMFNALQAAAVAAGNSITQVGSITTVGNDRQLRINTNVASELTPTFIFNRNGAIGSFSFTLFNEGQTETGIASTYTVISPNGTQIGQFVSSVRSTAESDANTIAGRIRNLIDNMVEQPINYGTSQADNVVTATADAGGAPAGDWRVTRNDHGQTVNQGNAVITNSTVTRGVDEVPATVLNITRTDDGVSTTNFVTLPSAASTDTIGSTLATINNVEYNASTNELTYTPARDTDTFSVTPSSGTFSINSEPDIDDNEPL